MTQLDRMEKKLEAMDLKLDAYAERITRSETKLNGFATIGTLILTGIIAALVSLLPK